MIGALSIGQPKLVTASGNVRASQGALLGIWVSAASATPTLAVYDDAATGTTTKIIDTFTPVAGTWYLMPIGVSNGINVVVGGTVSATVVHA